MNALLLVPLLLGAAGSAGGITWTAPEAWHQEPARPMRAATYGIPPAKGDAEGAEVAVFYFGEGQGGSVDANIQRWASQLKQPDGSTAQPRTAKATIHGLAVTTFEAKGAYSGGGMMMAPTAPKPSYRMLGAIVEGPKGPVFFKMVGPEKTVNGAEKAFHQLVHSVKPG